MINEMKLIEEFETKLKRPVTKEEKQLIGWICEQEKLDKAAP